MEERGDTKASRGSHCLPRPPSAHPLRLTGTRHLVFVHGEFRHVPYPVVWGSSCIHGGYWCGFCLAASHVVNSVYGTRMERDFEGVGWCAATSCVRKFANHSDVSVCSGDRLRWTNKACKGATELLDAVQIPILAHASAEDAGAAFAAN